MRLPKDIISKTYVKPKIYLCETDKTKICELDTCNTHGTFKFNSMSELTFDVPRVYNDIITGETKVNPFYDKIEALRLIELDDFGYFELQGPELNANGIEEVKSCTAYSLEYTLSQKYLEDFYINTGEIGSVEVTYAEEKYPPEEVYKHIQPVTLFNNNKRLSLLDLVIEKAYGWTIGHVDTSLRTLSRQFEVDRMSIYDFLMNEVCQKFNCYIVFDTINNRINIYAESPTAKFIGDGEANTFRIGSADPDEPLFSTVKTVSVDGYKTTRWSYVIQDNVGILYLEDTPQKDAMVEVVGVDSTWETDVFVTFDNLSHEINVNYDADNIKTVLSVTYGDDYDIREVNLGLPYLTDLSYYYTVDWMGQDLYDDYTAYLQKSNECQPEYSEHSKEILRLNDHIYYEENRLSLEYSLVNSVHSGTVGIYYTRQKNSDGSYYYTEVSLPAEYKVGVDYYSNATTNVTEENVGDLYDALQEYFDAYFDEKNGNSGASDRINQALTDLKDLSESFKFATEYTINNLYNDIQNTDINKKDEAVKKFLGYLWDELGRTPLKMLYLEPYKLKQTTNMDAGWHIKTHDSYGRYYPVVLFIQSLNTAITQRDTTIKNYETIRRTHEEENQKISKSLLMDNNFTAGQLMRLSAFLREDELHLDDIVQTSQDNLSSSFKVKQDAMESGRIELQKLCQPQLQFSMTMDNIYALPEFEPIIGQFQLGNIIKVGLRPDYIRQSRLLQVDINFDDFSDFSCDFGDLTNLRTQSDIHADLLAKAITAGKSVATNSSYWTRGSDVATATDLRIQQGLLDATTKIKAMDGSQGVEIDKYGIHLTKKLNPDSEEVDDKQAWLVNNMLLFTDDGWKTSKTGIGEFTVGDETFYGIIAEAMLAGYIEGSKIVGSEMEGGTINIGDGAFVVHEDGTVTMGAGGNTIAGYAKEEYVNGKVEGVQNQVQEIQNQVDVIGNSKMYSVEITTESPTIISSKDTVATMVCKIYSWGADVTDQYLDNKETSEKEGIVFCWKRTSTGTPINEGEVSDDVWNNMPEHQIIGSNKLEITHIDILENSSFTCEVNILPDEPTEEQ